MVTCGPADLWFSKTRDVQNLGTAGSIRCLANNVTVMSVHIHLSNAAIEQLIQITVLDLKGLHSGQIRKIKLHAQLRYFLENGLKSPEFCTHRQQFCIILHAQGKFCMHLCIKPP